jgi:hypothetical protein
VLGYEGGADIVSALDTSAKNQREVSTYERALAQEEEDAAVKSYTSSLAFRDSPEQILAAHDAAVAGSPILQRALAKNPRGLPGAREDLARIASTPAGLQALKDRFQGQSPESRAKIAELESKTDYNKARAIAAGRPDAADAVKPPSGYELNPNIPGALRFTPGGPADPVTRRVASALTPLQRRKETRQMANDKAGIDRLTAGLKSMMIPIYGLDNPAEKDAAGNVIKAAGKTPGLLSPGVDTSGIERLSSLLPSIPGGDAARAEALLESVNNQMKGVGRELLTSDDQGKLGNFAVKEWQIAADQVASLNPRKDPDGWKVKLDEIVRRLEKRIKLKEDEFEELYLDVEPSNAPPDAGAKPTAGGGKQVFEGITFERLDE